MASNIDPTKPTRSNPQTSDVRNNFQISADEISAIQTLVGDNPDIDGGGSAVVYTVKPGYVDGGFASVICGPSDQTFNGNVGNYVVDGGNATL